METKETKSDYDPPPASSSSSSSRDTGRASTVQPMTPRVWFAHDEKTAGLTLWKTASLIATAMDQFMKNKEENARLIRSARLDNTMHFLQAVGVSTDKYGPFDSMQKLHVKLRRKDIKEPEFEVYARSVWREWQQYEDLIIAFNLDVMNNYGLWSDVDGMAYVLRKIRWTDIETGAPWQSIVRYAPKPLGFELVHLQNRLDKKFPPPSLSARYMPADDTPVTEIKIEARNVDDLTMNLFTVIDLAAKAATTPVWSKLIGDALLAEIAAAKTGCQNGPAIQNFVDYFKNQVNEILAGEEYKNYQPEYKATAEHVDLLRAAVGACDFRPLDERYRQHMIRCQIERWPALNRYIALLGRSLQQDDEDVKNLQAKIQSALGKLESQAASYELNQDEAAERRVMEEVATSLSSALSNLDAAQVDVREATTVYFDTIMPAQLTALLTTYQRDSTVARASIDKIEQAAARLTEQLKTDAKEWQKDSQEQLAAVKRFLTSGGMLYSTVTKEVQEDSLYPIFVHLNNTEQTMTAQLVKRMDAKESKVVPIKVDLAFVNSTRASYIQKSAVPDNWLTVISALTDIASIIRFCFLME
jgi:hypothetical protein